MMNIEQLPWTSIRFVDKKREADINDIKGQYSQILATFSDKNRPKKEANINETFRTVDNRLSKQEGYVFEERQKAILQLKLARHFQKHETIDTNTLFDAVIESPKFLNVDKGSFHHLLEVHQQKTLQKIAEIRKNRVEMSSDEGINPPEELFITKSGNYRLVRLLNKSHLEKESLAMNHCVGTSDSYINEIIRGRTEIFSLQRIKGGKLKKYKPVLTIEYDVKKGTIKQIKKKNDKYLVSKDPLLDDVTDALKRLQDTKNDFGRPRVINKINPAELRNIRVKAENFLTDRGEIHFMDLDPEQNPLILKTGIIPLTGITNIEAAKLLQILEHLKLNPEQIALRANEVNENTKAYVGKLEQGIFAEIKKYNIENIYTSFPEGKLRIERNFEVVPITVEEFESKAEEYNKTIIDKSLKIRMSEYPEEMMKSKDFATLKTPELITLIHLRIRDLGFEENTTSDKVFNRAKQLGLEFCPPEVGPLKRLKDIDQPLRKHYLIAMKQIIDNSGIPCIFFLNRDECGLWLNDDTMQASTAWSPDSEFVFRLSKKPQS